MILGFSDSSIVFYFYWGLESVFFLWYSRLCLLDHSASPLLYLSMYSFLLVLSARNYSFLHTSNSFSWISSTVYNVKPTLVYNICFIITRRYLTGMTAFKLDVLASRFKMFSCYLLQVSHFFLVVQVFQCHTAFLERFH